jgi:hypothetical protein
MVPMLTREQIEEWREMLIDPAPWASEKQRVAAINALCDMALKSAAPAPVSETVCVPEALQYRAGHSDYGRGVVTGWNDCRKALLAAPHQNADQPKAADSGVKPAGVAPRVEPLK